MELQVGARLAMAKSDCDGAKKRTIEGRMDRVRGSKNTVYAFLAARELYRYALDHYEAARAICDGNIIQKEIIGNEIAAIKNNGLNHVEKYIAQLMPQNETIQNTAQPMRISQKTLGLVETLLCMREGQKELYRLFVDGKLDRNFALMRAKQLMMGSFNDHYKVQMLASAAKLTQAEIEDIALEVYADYIAKAKLAIDKKEYAAAGVICRKLEQHIADYGFFAYKYRPLVDEFFKFNYDRILGPQ
jgi:hypothetical protein